MLEPRHRAHRQWLFFGAFFQPSVQKVRPRVGFGTSGVMGVTDLGRIDVLPRGTTADMADVAGIDTEAVRECLVRLT